MVIDRLCLGAEPRRCLLIIDDIAGSNCILIADDRLLDWIAARIPSVGPNHGWHGRAHAIGIGLDGEIIAGMALMNVDRQHGNAEIAMAASTPRWASRSTIRKLLEYPFCQLGLRRVTTIIAASNATALKMNRQMGFKQEGIMRFGMGDEDAIIMGLLREEAEKWLQPRACPDNDVAYSMAATA